MKNLRHLPSIFCFVLVIAACNAVLGQSDDRQFASITGLGSSVRWDVAGPHAAVTLSVSTPDGQVISKEFAAGNAPEFRLLDANGERLPDGQYVYELRLTPIIRAEVKERLKAAREKGNSDEVQRDLKKRGLLPSRTQVQSGSFTVANGAVISPKKKVMCLGRDDECARHSAGEEDENETGDQFPFERAIHWANSS